MGRAKGDTARAKTRSASSSMAASLLPSGAAAVGFGGFVGSSRVESSLPSTSDASVVLQVVDSEIAQHLKRLSRRDPITKIKALQSLSQLIKEKTPKEIVTVIPLWVFEYKKLLLDYNREVRRATHTVMHNLVSAVGRDLAPHLKPLMGPWWFSQFDLAHEVSQAARRSFQAAFPAQERRMDALILYSSEILTYLEEIFKSTPQSLSDKATAADELEEVHQQAISSSLLAFAALLDALTSLPEFSSSENVNAESKISLRARTSSLRDAEKLFSSHKYFLAYLKSPNAVLRSAEYSLLKSCIKNIPHTAYEGDIKLLSVAILGSFEEKSPTCHSSMWDALLFFSKSFPESWTAINAQKIVFSRLWDFLRNGCFGSQQVSYPALVVFLETIPLKSFSGYRFFLDFSRSLWGGRMLSYSSQPDMLAFFQAVEECYAWILRNAHRCYDGVDAVLSFQHIFVDEIVLGLLWCEYLMVCSAGHMNITLSPSEYSEANSEQPNDKQLSQAVNIKHLMDSESNLGKCIVGILSGMYSISYDLLLVFSSRFQENYLGTFQNFENHCNVQWAIEFINLLDKHARVEAWPLTLVAPAFKKLFQLDGSIDSPKAVELLVATLWIFGPRSIARELAYFGGEDKQFLQFFEEIIIPMCLKEFNTSRVTRLDLLLAFLDDEFFDPQWNAILAFLIDRHNEFDASVLAILIEKIRERIGNSSEFSMKRKWHHDLLDFVAVNIVRAFPKFGVSDSRFLCAALGGSSEVNNLTFLSQNTLLFIFEELCRMLMSFMKHSTVPWVQDLWPCLTAAQDFVYRFSEFSSSILNAAELFLDVLRTNFSGFYTIDAESRVVEGIIVAIFVIDWEFSFTNESENISDVELLEVNSSELAFCAAVHGLRRSEAFDHFLKGLDVERHKFLVSKLIESIRCIIIECEIRSDKLISCCFDWTMDVFKTFCVDKLEEQRALEHLIRNADLLPIWIKPDETGSLLEPETFLLNTPKNTAFVALIDKLISELGFDRVVGGIVSQSSNSDPDVNLAVNKHNYSRPWLATEILCTWEWPGGSVLDSFLDHFLGFVKNGNSDFSVAVFNILLEGALSHGSGSGLNLLCWHTADELDDVEGPFLRGFLCLLISFLEHHLWGKEKASSLFGILLDKLYIGGDVNLSCLRILPCIINVLVAPLTAGFDDHLDCVSDPCSQLHHTTVDWLKRCISFPPLNLWHTGEGMEDWVQLVIACFPINFETGLQNLKPFRHVLPAEKAALYELFQKQKQGTSAVVSKLALSQKLLSNLIAVSVAYCSAEFDEDDWKYALHLLRVWIGTAVVMMEEVVENVNEVFANTPNDVKSSPAKLQSLVEACDSLPLKVAEFALVGFCLCCSDAGLKDDQHPSNLNPLQNEKWEFIKDCIFEDILRLFFCTAAAEAIAVSHCPDTSTSASASDIIASSRWNHWDFWELVCSCAVQSSPYARDKAMKSFELWGLSEGLISSLYTVLFSCQPTPPFQLTAFVLLSTEPLHQVALLVAADDENPPDAGPAEENVSLRQEISQFISNVPPEAYEMNLVADERVNLLLAWCLLLSYIASLPPLSPARDKVIQYVQISATSVILDCLFQHISLEQYFGSASKKKHAEASATVTEAANSAARAVTTCSVLFSLEDLWPVTPESMSSFAGAVFGLMLHSLPAYVREWFGNIRDASAASAIESFTKTWCSRTLISNELLQIKKANFADENFSITVSKVANEIVATYTKDETGMDLVIRLHPSYPLRPVDVDCTRSLGFSSVKKGKWLLSLMSFVRNQVAPPSSYRTKSDSDQSGIPVPLQNGAIAEAIRTWKSNIDKEFEGVEDCPICYSVIHTVNHSLPRLACCTCKHKFHSVCLRKWFSTSLKSVCPLCQSTFSMPSNPKPRRRPAV